MKAGYDAKDDGEAAWQDSNLLIIFNGVIYPIFNDYSWDRELRNLYFAGSGAELACGSITKYIRDKENKDLTIKEAEEAITEAIEIACSWNAFCSLPINIMIQKA